MPILYVVIFSLRGSAVCVCYKKNILVICQFWLKFSNRILFEKNLFSNMNRIYIIIISSILYQSTLALYFHIGETERKCFIEEVPDETLVVGKFWI